MVEGPYVCRACGQGVGLTQVRPASITGELTSDDFAISDLRYGVTAAIYHCSACGLLQCPDVNDVLAFYERLEDPQYEEGREQRYLQAEQIVKTILRTLDCADGQGKRLLDVGAGSGILLQAARKAGFSAVGIEPSSWLVAKAHAHGLEVHEGVLPHASVSGSFDVVTLIDVIEHVIDPGKLLSAIREVLKPGGVAIVVTPDVSALVARALSYRWWHYRIAHITYFNKKTLTIMTERAGLAVMKFSRPGWYFSYVYLRERLLQYLPPWLVPPVIGPLRGTVISLNLGDSLLMVCERPQ